MPKPAQIKDLIVFEDDHLIALNKPYGIATLHERIGEGTSLIELLRSYNPDAQLCHRLDRETSGIILAAKNPEVYREMAIAFEHRKVKKLYLAIVHGRHYFDHTEVNFPLTVSSKGKAKVDKREGKEAQTVFTSIEQFGHFTLVECQPVTGRLHQIRIHLATQNAPIAADETYGGAFPYLSDVLRHYQKGRDREMRPMIQRIALHAYQISFRLFDNEYVLKAPLHKDMEVFLKLLRKNDASI